MIHISSYIKNSIVLYVTSLGKYWLNIKNVFILYRIKILLKCFETQVT